MKLNHSAFFKRTVLVLFCTALVSACSSNDPSRSSFFSAYKVDIPQGNYITKEMLAQVKTGMPAQQVKFALGAPLLTPVFSADRWDYVFRYQHANGSSDLRRVVIRFTDAKVSAIEADELPSRDDGSDKALPNINRSAPRKSAS